ncbi:Sec-independent protein translocase protein TatB [Bartonella phoceensis]|uniref:Sec-independent protein translocase protein TatB n=1 Tax=Bartonella phoceensis TaxID=270249 RepID=UPI001ABAF3BD|nr:Sec-independent protein translocase protein TatB [Bartonella phoceensis]
MFGIDGSELLVILLVLIIVVGPKDLPKMLKTMAKAVAYVHSTANEFHRQFDDAMKQAELDDLQKTLSDNNDFNLNKELTETYKSIHDEMEGIHDNFDIEISHHKSEKEKEILRCNQNQVNEDLTVSVESKDSKSISLISKEKEDVS